MMTSSLEEKVIAAATTTTARHRYDDVIAKDLTRDLTTTANSNAKPKL